MKEWEGEPERNTNKLCLPNATLYLGAKPGQSLPK